MLMHDLSTLPVDITNDVIAFNVVAVIFPVIVAFDAFKLLA